MRILRAADHRPMPWKNGGGTTVEIMAWPQGAGLDDFDWRLSMATVEQDGPFSNFPGVDRTLAMLEGRGIALTVADGPAVVLTPDSDPLAFPADAPTMARLLGGPIVDFNVMTRRGCYRHSISRLTLDAEGVRIMLAATALIFCRKGALEIENGGQAAGLVSADTALLAAGNVTLRSRAPQPGAALLVSLEPED